jgi:hypothetical protein
MILRPWRDRCSCSGTLYLRGLFERNLSVCVCQALPDRYLRILRREPYTQFEWSARFQRLAVASEPLLRNVAWWSALREGQAG